MMQLTQVTGSQSGSRRVAFWCHRMHVPSQKHCPCTLLRVGAGREGKCPGGGGGGVFGAPHACALSKTLSLHIAQEWGGEGEGWCITCMCLISHSVPAHHLGCFWVQRPPLCLTQNIPLYWMYFNQQRGPGCDVPC